MRNETVRLLAEAIERRGARPAAEQFEEMVRRGAIDREGNVTLRRPDGNSFVPDDGSSREAPRGS